MGQLLGRTKEADDYVAYYQSAMQTVRSRLAAAHPAPTPTFLWRAPGYYDCCSTFARSNLGSLVTAAGGTNIADTLLSSQQGTLSPETVLNQNPAVVIATGANWSPATPAVQGGFVSLGYDETRARAQQQLQGLVTRQAGFTDLQAVRNHRVFVAWHHFYDSPYNVLAVEWFAKWMHPELFGDIDPDATIRELHEKFLPIAPGGTFSADLP
jgi:iron complex transport system substrate-binding protein